MSTEQTDTTTDQPKDLVALAREYFNSTNPSDLEGAIVAMAERIQALEVTVAELRAALGH